MCNLFCSSGSKDYVVEVGDSAVGPWTKIAEGQMEASKPFPLIEITFGHPYSGRFVQYRCVTWWSNYCGLQFIGVYKVGGKCFSWADGTDDPFLSLDCARLEGVGALGDWGTIQGKEGIKFCSVA